VCPGSLGSRHSVARESGVGSTDIEWRERRPGARGGGTQTPMTYTCHARRQPAFRDALQAHCVGSQGGCKQSAMSPHTTAYKEGTLRDQGTERVWRRHHPRCGFVYGSALAVIEGGIHLTPPGLQHWADGTMPPLYAGYQGLEDATTHQRPPSRHGQSLGGRQTYAQACEATWSKTDRQPSQVVHTASRLTTDDVNDTQEMRGECRRLAEVEGCEYLRLVDEGDTARLTCCVETKNNHLRSTGDSGRCAEDHDAGL